MALLVELVLAPLGRLAPSGPGEVGHRARRLHTPQPPRSASDLTGGAQDIVQSVPAFFALRFYVARALDEHGDALYRTGAITAWLVAGGGLVFELEVENEAAVYFAQQGAT